MEKERKIKTLSLVALIVAILGLTVAFAALSQTLTINGTANVNTATWDIHFENLNSVYLNGAQINKEPVLNQTVISNIDVTLTKPNDVATFSVDMVNDGSIDAKISSVEVSPLCEASSPVSSCDWDNDGVVTEQDIKKVNDNISFFVVYVGTTKFLKENDTLKKGETKKIGIGIVYVKVVEGDDGFDTFESTELPKRDLTFDNLSVSINFVQAD